MKVKIMRDDARYEITDSTVGREVELTVGVISHIKKVMKLYEEVQALLASAYGED